MSRGIQHVALVLLGCFALLFVQLNRIQVLEAEALRDHPENTRTVQRDFERPRGRIVTADGVVVARSEPAEGSFERRRVYPEGELYAHSVGWFSFNLGADGVERSWNDQLSGRTPGLQISGLASVLDDPDETGEVVLHLDHELQSVARDALGDRPGAVVVLDPRDGAVRALWGYPSFDPNELAGFNGAEVNEVYTQLLEADSNPLRAPTHREIYFPGSTFKIVTAAAALEAGVVTLDEPVFAEVDSYLPRFTERAIANFGGRTCGGPLRDLVRRSCNAGFAEIGAELVGADALVAAAEAFGFNAEPPIDLPDASTSVMPTDFGIELEPPTPEVPAGVVSDVPRLAQASIGQNDVAASPLQMALVAAGVANSGRVPAPRVVDRVLDARGRAVESTAERVWTTATTPAVAAELRETMLLTVADGTARGLARDGWVVGAKTGTAQVGSDPPRSHAWMIAFAGRAGQPPEVAIAVFVEGLEGSVDATGGSVAGPIAGAVLDAALRS